MASELGWPEPHYKTTESPCGPAPWPPEGVPFGNAIPSRYPLLSQEFWDLPASREESAGERKLLRAKIVIEGVQFHVYSTHLAAHPGATPEGDIDRNLQAQAIVSRTEADRQDAESGGGGVPFRGVILGDFNASPDDAASVTMRGSFVDAWDALYELDDPARYTVSPRSQLHSRINYIYLSTAHPWPVFQCIVDAEVLSDHLLVAAEI